MTNTASVCVYACVHVCVRARVCVCACGCGCGCVHARARMRCVYGSRLGGWLWVVSGWMGGCVLVVWGCRVGVRVQSSIDYFLETTIYTHNSTQLRYQRLLSLLHTLLLRTRRGTTRQLAARVSPTAHIHSRPMCGAILAPACSRTGGTLSLKWAGFDSRPSRRAPGPLARTTSGVAP